MLRVVFAQLDHKYAAVVLWTALLPLASSTATLRMTAESASRELLGASTCLAEGHLADPLLREAHSLHDGLVHES